MAGQDNDSGGVLMTKALLLAGNKHSEDVATSMGVFKIRPLTEGEKARIEAVSVKGIKASGKSNAMQSLDVTMDLDTMVANDYEVKAMTLAADLSVGQEKWGANDVKSISLPPDVISLLLTKIREISGMANVDDIIRKFRSQQGGANTGNDGVDRGPQAG